MNLRDELHDVALGGLATGRQQLFVAVQRLHAWNGDLLHNKVAIRLSLWRKDSVKTRDELHSSSKIKRRHFTWEVGGSHAHNDDTHRLSRRLDDRSLRQ